MDVWIVKLGGSIITAKKTGKPTIRKKLLAGLCRELVTAMRQHSKRRFIILHGAGSLGHPLVHKFDLLNTPLTSRRMAGMSQIVTNMRHLTDCIASELQKGGAKPFPIQTGTFFSSAGSKLPAQDMIMEVLKAEGVPVLGGDMVIAGDGQLSVMSADTLAVKMAQALPVKKILFASDIEGVYAHFPPQAEELPVKKLSRQELQALAKQGASNSAHDVTGGMVGKLTALLPLKGVEVVIFNGQKISNLRAALRSESIGTTITI